MPATGTLTAHWLAETLRLREEHWGPLEDGAAVRTARAGASDLAGRILLRARLLAEQSGLAATVQRWRRAAMLALAAAAVLAVAVGAGAALASLGDGTRPVNVVWALGTLLGLHALTFLFWLASLAWRTDAGTGLAGLWLWAARRLARGPDAALAPQAWTGLLARHGALRWFLGCVVNGLWLLALAASLAALLAALSTRRYDFAWETTILQPGLFVQLAGAIGWLPAKLGFAVPDAAMVLASDGVQTPPPGAQALWASWLAGALLVYGLLPRLMALLVCASLGWRALRGMQLDTGLPGYAALRGRLLPDAERLAQPDEQPGRASPRRRAPAAGATRAAVLAGIELPADMPWPPAGLPGGVHCHPVLDTRDQRHGLLEALVRQPPARLLVACDARQTPDRGTLALIVELAAHAGATRIWLVQAAQAPRAALWRGRLAEAGFGAESVGEQAASMLAWLEQGDG